MNVGELFVSLGIKGGEKTLSTLGLAQDGMGKIRDLSFEAKAAIAAATYALEKMFAASGQHGVALEALSTVLGTSTKTLQEYEYAAKKVGISNEQLGGTFMSLSKISTDILMGKARPEGMNRLMDTLRQHGEILKYTGPGESFQTAAQNPEVLLKALQSYSQVEQNKALRNAVLSSFGITDPNMIRALVEGRFNPKEFREANVLTAGQVKSLDQNFERFTAIKDKLGVGFEKIVAAFGPQFLTEIEKITPKVLGLAEAFARLVDDAPVLQGIGKIFEGWGYIFDGITAAVKEIREYWEWFQHSDAGAEFNKRLENIEGGASSAVDAVTGVISKGAELIESAKSLFGAQPSPQQPAAAGPAGSQARPALPQLVVPRPAGAQGAAPAALAPRPALGERQASPAPRVQVIAPPQASAGPSAEINQTLNFQSTPDNPGAVAHDVKKAVRDAFRQHYAIGQVG